MSDPFMPPFLILVGLALGYWGWRKTYEAIQKPAGDFRYHPQVAPKTKLESTLMRANEALDSITIFVVGVGVFIFGVFGLMDIF